MPSINVIQVIGIVTQAPVMKQTKYSQYLHVDVMTKDVYSVGSEYKESTEMHEVRIFGNQARMLSQELNEGDRVYCEGTLKSFDKKFYINVKAVRIVAKQANVYPKTKV